jgi:hypothetical protein
MSIVVYIRAAFVWFASNPWHRLLDVIPVLSKSFNRSAKYLIVSLYSSINVIKISLSFIGLEPNPKRDSITGRSVPQSQPNANLFLEYPNPNPNPNPNPVESRANNPVTRDAPIRRSVNVIQELAV